MNAECYCNFQSIGKFIGKDTSRQVAQVELRNFVGYLQQCLHRINFYFVSILVLLFRIRSFFHLILFSYFIDFVSFRFIFFSLLYRFRRFFSLDFVFLLYRFRFISFHFVFLLYRFRFLTLQISLDFVFVSFRFFSFLSLPVPHSRYPANNLVRT